MKIRRVCQILSILLVLCGVAEVAVLMQAVNVDVMLANEEISVESFSSIYKADLGAEPMSMEKFDEAQKAWQKQTTMEVASYAVEIAQDEAAYQNEIEERAKRQEKFLEQQEEISRYVDELRQEGRSKGSSDGSLPDTFEDLPAGMGEVYDPDSLSITTEGVGSAPEMYITRDYSSYTFPPIYPSDEREQSLYIPPTEMATLPELAGFDDYGADYQKETPDVQSGEGVLVAPSAPPAFDDVGYHGQYSARIVCTCPDCIDTDTYPDATLSTNRISVETSYVPNGSRINAQLDDGTTLGTFITQDSKGNPAGRNIIIYCASHDDMRPAFAYVKLYDAS